MPKLDFDTLRRNNVARCEESFHRVDHWSLTDWATAMGGECGEALNIVKKLRRLDDEVGTNSWNQSGDRDRSKLIMELAMELADLVTYADLLATAAGIDLGNSVVEKFNQISMRVGSGVSLEKSSE